MVSNKEKQQKNNIPVFFAVDDNYAPYFAVALKSIQENASENYNYTIICLHAGIKLDTKKRIKTMETHNFKIKFVNVALQLIKTLGQLHTRDYYTKTTYYRLFIQKMFPQYDKVLYLDSDIVVKGDISELYNIDLGDNMLGAVNEDVMRDTEVFGNYAETVLCIDRKKFFNAGILVINLKKFRQVNVEKQFLNLIFKYKFTVTQDEDYLNVICKNKVLLLDEAWNKSPVPQEYFDNNSLKIAHFKMNMKPWHYDDVLFGDIFWEYAKKTAFFSDIMLIKTSFSEEDALSDKKCYDNLVNLAISECKKNTAYRKSLTKKSRFGK